MAIDVVHLPRYFDSEERYVETTKPDHDDDGGVHHDAKKKKKKHKHKQ